MIPAMDQHPNYISSDDQPNFAAATHLRHISFSKAWQKYEGKGATVESWTPILAVESQGSVKMGCILLKSSDLHRHMGRHTQCSRQRGLLCCCSRIAHILKQHETAPVHGRDVRLRKASASHVQP